MEWKKLNPTQPVLYDFKSSRSAYLKKINWQKITAYLKLDVYRSHITKTYPLSENNHTAYYQQMDLLRLFYPIQKPLLLYQTTIQGNWCTNIVRKNKPF